MKDQEKNLESQPKGAGQKPQMEVVKNSEPVKAAETPKSEVERLKKELETLKAQLAEKPMSLEDKIKFYQAKQDNILKLTRLDGFATSLITIGEEVQNSIGDNDFSSEKYSIAITKKDYSHSNPLKVLEINNPVLVAEVLDFALVKINFKRTQLQTLIEA